MGEEAIGTIQYHPVPARTILYYPALLDNLKLQKMPSLPIRRKEGEEA